MKTLLLLAVLVTAPVSAAPPFERPPWRDLDRDCQTTRTEVILAQCSRVDLDARGCIPVRVICLDVYSGAEVSTDSPSQAIQVDHLFPASEAWKRRAWQRPDGSPCTSARKTRTDPGCPAYEVFFNDPGNLLVTRSRTNGQKSDLMPDEWCPALREGRILAAHRLQIIAARYGLPLRPEEQRAITAWARGECYPGARVLGGT